MSVTARLEAVRARIAAACDAAGRDPSSVSLLAVSKRHSVDAIREAAAAGQDAFGENYVQEMVAKRAELPDVAFRFIGHLQRNKVRQVVRARAAIDTVDSLKLLRAIDRISVEEGTVTDICLQVNVAGEAQKSGCAPDELEELVEAARGADGVRLEGLMVIPPAGDPEDARPHFRALRELAETHGLDVLSMGMSADLEIAVAEGATMVRVGTAVFGSRD